MGEKVIIGMMSAGREGSNSNIFSRLVYMPEADIWTVQEATSSRSISRVQILPVALGHRKSLKKKIVTPLLLEPTPECEATQMASGRCKLTSTAQAYNDLKDWLTRF
jgi:hypothetical protein